jgi:hypothetical protein
VNKIRITAQDPLDAEWYRRLLMATENVVEVFIMLEPDPRQLEEERAKFFASGCTANPELRPWYLEKAAIGYALDNLHELLAAVIEEESNEHIREAYAGHIQERITKLEMIRASISGDHGVFVAKNQELYGQPDRDIFAAICAWVRQEAENTAAEADSALAIARDDVLRLVPALTGEPAMLVPRDDMFKKVREMHFAPGGYFDQLLAPIGMPEKPYIEQLYGDEITKQAISNIGSDYRIGTATDGLWSVLTSSRQVMRPQGYRVDRDYFIGVIAHEVGSHLLEEANGENQSLQLLRVGLHGYEKGNEGRAYLREQIIYPEASVFVRQASWEYILMLYLSVCLAAGVDDKPYSFIKLYDCLFALHRFWRERRYPLDTNNEAEAREEAWLLAVRIMKGTDGTGGCYMKDTVYLQGNIACWQLADTGGPETIFQGDIGKFNIADESHFAILRGLGILPAVS